MGIESISGVGQSWANFKCQAKSEVKSKGVVDAIYDYIFGPSTPAGCGGDAVCGPVCEQVQDGGVPMNPPDATGDATTVLDSGAILTDTGVILPTDDGGVPILPEDVFFTIEGEGSFFQETPNILLESDYLVGAGLESLSLRVELGTDSTRIAGMPAEGCFDGMINSTVPTPEDIADGVNCPEPGYESFLACPSDPAERLHVFVAGYTVEGYRRVGADWEKIGESVTEVITAEQLYTLDPADPTDATILDEARLGEVCGENPLPLTIPVPAEFHEDGALALKLKLRLIVDARGKDPVSYFMTALRARILGE